MVDYVSRIFECSPAAIDTVNNQTVLKTCLLPTVYHTHQQASVTTLRVLPQHTPKSVHSLRQPMHQLTDLLSHQLLVNSQSANMKHAPHTGVSKSNSGTRPRVCVCVWWSGQVRKSVDRER